MATAATHLLRDDCQFNKARQSLQPLPATIFHRPLPNRSLPCFRSPVDATTALADNLSGSYPGEERIRVKSRKVVAVLPAAGQGERMGLHKKQFLKLEGTPILLHTLRKFVACEDITEIFIAARPEDLSEIQGILSVANMAKKITVVSGGNRRQDSVENCLRVLPPDTELVAVHDAVRPFVSPALISEAVQEAARTGACILGIPPVDTIKQVDRTRILGTFPRERIVLAQTPQVFRYDILIQAFDKAREDSFQGTDEAALVEHLGLEVSVVRGSDRNIKITKPSDLELARFFLAQERDKPGEPSHWAGELASAGRKRPSSTRRE
ncbi:MAG: 2-C-methyl-D-erythritol 4-phosphate cytidylyltransferase [Acidobacteria bacterium]|nr:2-C-methyl-D-erythritol 4-phosphate cytidylyltransferase [Acidobacteriota bacterium]